nr:ATP-binding protein [Tomitella fengzijianii]
MRSLMLVAGIAIGAAAGVAAGPRLREWVDRRRYLTHGPSPSKLLELVVDDSPTGIAVVDGGRDIVLFNRRATELGLVQGDELDDRAWAAARKVLSERHPVDFDLMGDQRSQVRSMSVRGQARVLDDRVGRYALLFADDDSEIVRMESARRDFVANVSHELKTPVGAMGLLAEALLESADDPETVRHFGQKVQGEATRLGAMVSELIALSRLQGAEKLPNLEEVEVDAIVAAAMDNAELTADAAEIEITTDAPSGLRVLGDEMLLTTALTNLISNAVNYSPKGSPVAVSRALRRGQVQISVTDHGIGIAPKYQERVFERFFRVDKARSRETGGTGLGLAIVKHVAINHNGRIRLWSKPGTGSTFTLELPAHVQDRVGEPTAPQSPPGPPRPDPDHREDIRR